MTTWLGPRHREELSRRGVKLPPTDFDRVAVPCPVCKSASGVPCVWGVNARHHPDVHARRESRAQKAAGWTASDAQRLRDAVRDILDREQRERDDAFRREWPDGPPWMTRNEWVCHVTDDAEEFVAYYDGERYEYQLSVYEHKSGRFAWDVTFWLEGVDVDRGFSSSRSGAMRAAMRAAEDHHGGPLPFRRGPRGAA